MHVLYFMCNIHACICLQKAKINLFVGFLNFLLMYIYMRLIVLYYFV